MISCCWFVAACCWEDRQKIWLDFYSSFFLFKNLFPFGWFFSDFPLLPFYDLFLFGYWVLMPCLLCLIASKKLGYCFIVLLKFFKEGYWLLFSCCRSDGHFRLAQIKFQKDIRPPFVFFLNEKWAGLFFDDNLHSRLKICGSIDRGSTSPRPGILPHLFSALAKNASTSTYAIFVQLIFGFDPSCSHLFPSHFFSSQFPVTYSVIRVLNFLEVRFPIDPPLLSQLLRAPNTPISDLWWSSYFQQCYPNSQKGRLKMGNSVLWSFRRSQLFLTQNSHIISFLFWGVFDYFEWTLEAALNCRSFCLWKGTILQTIWLLLKHQFYLE